MTEPGTHCSHGKRWDEDCAACELVSAREIIAHWGEKVDEARAVIDRAEEKILSGTDWPIPFAR
jgi:hypothetical protein